MSDSTESVVSIESPRSGASFCSIFFSRGGCLKCARYSQDYFNNGLQPGADVNIYLFFVGDIVVSFLNFFPFVTVGHR